MASGTPVLGDLPYHGYCLAAQLNDTWGLYVVSGTAAQLTAINALPDTYAICTVTESEGAKWPELDSVITSARRTRINSWLTARGLPTIPAGWTYRRTLEAIGQRIRANYTIDSADVAEVPA